MILSEFTIDATHVPSDPDVKHPRVAWSVVVKHNGHTLGTFEYHTGTGKIPGHKNIFVRVSLHDHEENEERLRLACVEGKRCGRPKGDFIGGQRLTFWNVKRLDSPTVADVLYCLASDAGLWLGVADVDAFADELGIDVPSVAFASYAACGVAARALLQAGGSHDSICELMQECDQ